MQSFMTLGISIMLLAAAALFGLNAAHVTHSLVGLQIIPENWIPQVARVDLSTVSTLVPLLTLWHLRKGMKQLHARRATPGVAAAWYRGYPFPPGFPNFLVQLGLIGTLFGFCLAFGSFEGGDELSPRSILDPLGTALWSSFIGVAFAYLVVPPIAHRFASAIEQTLPLAGPRAQLDALAESVRRLIDPISTAETAVEAFNRKISEASQSQLASKVADLDQKLELVNTAVSDLKASINVLAASTDRNTNRVKLLTDALAGSERTTSELASRVAAAMETMTSHRTELSRLVPAMSPLQASLDSLSRRLERGAECYGLLTASINAASKVGDAVKSAAADLRATLLVAQQHSPGAMIVSSPEGVNGSRTRKWFNGWFRRPGTPARPPIA